jgi:hypothetical protein
MQEEIGTGGAGFRYLYAGFLHEASVMFNNDKTLQDASDMLMSVGDEFREFALMIAKAIKAKNDIDYQLISQKLYLIADEEAQVYKKLTQFYKKH